jgi:two-component system KDP operon response regulator KdpE
MTGSDVKQVVKLLLVEDEVQIRKLLNMSMSEHGYVLIEAGTAKEALEHIANSQPQIIVLDLGLPDMDGVELTRKIREWSNIPIIVISARGREDDKVKALDAGADDYLTKPFGLAELLARLRVSLRRLGQADDVQESPIFQLGRLKVDLVKRRVFADNNEVHLTPTEYKMLLVFIRNRDKVITQHQMLREVWGEAYTNELHYLRVYMAQLRHKLEENPARPVYLLTEPGIGYRLAVESE